MTPKIHPQGSVPLQDVDQQAIVPHDDGEQLSMDISREMDASLFSASGPDLSRAEASAEPRGRTNKGRLTATSPGTPYGKVPNASHPYRSKYDYNPTISTQVRPDRALLREKLDKLEFRFFNLSKYEFS